MSEPEVVYIYRETRDKLYKRITELEAREDVLRDLIFDAHECGKNGEDWASWAARMLGGEQNECDRLSERIAELKTGLRTVRCWVEQEAATNLEAQWELQNIDRVLRGQGE